MSVPENIRVDLQHVADLVTPKARLLDVGCGDGALLAYLKKVKQVDGRGLELAMSKVRAAVGHGVPVVQGNLETDLADYPSDAFDYVVLSQTLQATHNPRIVLEDLLRIGKRVIVSFPNFGHWRVRLSLLFGGRMPVTGVLSNPWFDTPNIHLCTISDFIDLTRAMNITIEKSYALDDMGRRLSFAATAGRANLLSQQGLFVLTRA
jgi:methionine biosynthesis protein MetW